MGIKDEIIEKYHLDKSHKVWQPEIDNWFSVEVFRQQTGFLPNDLRAPKDELRVMMDFLDNHKLHKKLLAERGLEFGSMYLSAKRFLMRHINQLK